MGVYGRRWTPVDSLCLTRNEQVSGSSPLGGSLERIRVPLCMVHEVENKINRTRIYFGMPAEHGCKGRTEEREA
jgi:hypothetical protein